jgi:hypothetical protein
MRVLISLILLSGLQAPGATLVPWSDAIEVGGLDSMINEASGLAVSAWYGNRLYHVNDSGDTGRFFLTDMTGANAQSVRVSGFNPVDVEDLSIGPCGQSSECLFLADIGDNSRKRPWIEIVVVPEREHFPATVPALARLRLRYPDRAHDAESLAVHPDGTLYLLTKERMGDGKSAQSGIPRLFKLSPDWWKDLRSPQTLDHVADLDLGRLIPNAVSSARLPTAMDIARDGKRVLILAYIDALELAVDFSQPLPDVTSWKEGRDYQRIRLVNLDQQEAIAYLPHGNGFLYDTEVRRSSTSPGRLIQMSR